jgi:addiction module HigA family antidote
LLKVISGISPEMTLRPSRVLGRTSESWLVMQDRYDLWMARSTVNLDALRPLDFEAA